MKYNDIQIGEKYILDLKHNRSTIAQAAKQFKLFKNKEVQVIKKYGPYGKNTLKVLAMEELDEHIILHEFWCSHHDLKLKGSLNESND